MADGCFNRDVLGIQPSDFQQITREPIRGILPEAQGIPRHGSGDPLLDRFRHMVVVTDFMIWGRQARPRGPSRAQNRALTRNDIWQ